jgi:hypothetical protein
VLPASSVDLGVIEIVGYISERAAVAAHLNTAIWKLINYRAFHEESGARGADGTREAAGGLWTG